MTTRLPTRDLHAADDGCCIRCTGARCLPYAVITMHPHPCCWHSERIICRARGSLHSELTHTGSGP